MGTAEHEGRRVRAAVLWRGAALLAILAFLAPAAWYHIGLLSDRRATRTAVDAHLQRADQALADGDLARAMVALEAVRALTPADPALQER